MPSYAERYPLSDATDSELVEIVVVSRITLRDQGCPVRLLMKNCCLLPKSPLGCDCEHVADRVFEHFGQHIESVGVNRMHRGRHPGSKGTNFEPDLRSDIGFGKSRGIPEVDGVWIILVDHGRKTDLFLTEKILPRLP